MREKERYISRDRDGEREKGGEKRDKRERDPGLADASHDTIVEQPCTDATSQSVSKLLFVFE